MAAKTLQYAWPPARANHNQTCDTLVAAKRQTKLVDSTATLCQLTYQTKCKKKTLSHDDAVEHCETFEYRWMNLCVWIIAKTIEVSLNITINLHENMSEGIQCWLRQTASAVKYY